MKTSERIAGKPKRMFPFPFDEETGGLGFVAPVSVVEPIIMCSL